MFVFNVRVTAPKKTAFIIASATVVIAIICIICMVSMHKAMVPNSATCDEIGTFSLCANTSDEQCRFLEQFGLSADKNSVKSQTVTIPSTFNSTYEQYNQIQKKIGLDLCRYSGKSVKKITYMLKNSSAQYAVLLIYNGKVIGAHLTNGEYGQSDLPLV